MSAKPTQEKLVKASTLQDQTRLALLSRERGISHIGGVRGCKDVLAYPIPRECAEKINWVSFMKDCQLGRWGEHARSFDWVSFFSGSSDGIPADPYLFVDNMLVNGIVVEPGTAKIVSEWLPQLIGKVYGATSALTAAESTTVTTLGTGAGGGQQRPPGGQ